MPNPFNDAAAERSNRRVLSTARRQAAEREARLQETARELELARRDIENPRPEHWEADRARYRKAKADYDAARVGLALKPRPMIATRYPELLLDRVGPKDWRFADAQTRAHVGERYKSKTEALADLDGYARRGGWVQ